ncbi:MAG: glycogen-debranching protein, partial [Myxococcales bacterium]|nr:glycogen-debranching protein [Myxococcales bacterium]
DVVFNHTAEGDAWNQAGDVAPFFSWRGLDNTGYYQLGQDAAHYQNDNGVGPNLASTQPIARDIVIDALRYWHEELGVDGFRFDLAPILANGCEQGCFAFDANDPDGILRRAAAELPDAWLIAEPWGTGPGTYQIGHFPPGWAEWNGAYRDTIRDDQNRSTTAAVTPGWLADRLSGSWSLFGDDGRPPAASINFVVAHDGLTHGDLYRCNGKNNGQPWPYGPSDGGTDDDRAWDQGGDPVAQRQAARTGMALLLVSAGVPMITGGDEMRRTQQCNNNAYNLDSPGIWLDWSLLASEERFHAFARSMLRFRRDHPALRPAAYRPFVDGNGNGLPAVAFFRDDGAVADAPYLDDASRHFLALRIDGEEAGDPARSLFIAYNGWDQGIVVTLPATATGQTWHLVSDTHAWLEGEGNFYAPGQEPVLPQQDEYLLGGRALLILVESP